ncbi:MAG: class I SAM-dependent methyltransferase [Gammaproteobacteria bacterium]|nr:class I SAM-dependent methyltransferase [Gammaproteobacteria bacterium]MBU1416174.1 class I SAM-dependent methyltransferase [Gammaproteobacteria bacterium]
MNQEPEVVRAPHKPLTDYYADEQERQGFVRDIFDQTAPDYDRIENLLAFGSGPWYRRQALLRAGLQPGMRVVDIGTGTGLTAREAVAIVGDGALVTGVDPSAGMLANAALPAGVSLVDGRAEAIPLPDAGFDFLSMGYALRHVGDLSTACAEFHRVLKPGGRLCLLEITRPESGTGRLLLKGYMRGVVPALATLIGKRKETAQLWRYYWDTIEHCASPASIVATLADAGFTDVRHHVETRALSVLAEYQARKPD